MPHVDRSQLLSLVTGWERGEISIRELHQAAERIWDEGGEWPILQPSDPNSISVEALSFLECLNHQRLVEDDLPALLRFLRTPIGAEDQGWGDWQTYWSGIDFNKRQVTEDGYAY